MNVKALKMDLDNELKITEKNQVQFMPDVQKENQLTKRKNIRNTYKTFQIQNIILFGVIYTGIITYMISLVIWG